MKTWARIPTVLFAGLVLAAQFPGAAQTVQSAAAPTVPSATYSIHVNTPSTTSHSPGTLAGGSSGATASATAGAFPSPFLDMSATSSALAGDLASGDIKYYFEFFGPAGTLPIDLKYNASFSADQGCCTAGGGSTFVDLQLTLSDTVNGIDSICMANTTNCSNFFGSTARDADPIHSSASGTLIDTLSANTVYEIELSADAGAFQDPANPSAHAFLDPFISIDPSFTGDPNAYSLILSNGVGNSAASTSSTPEPAALVLAGLGLALFAFRRIRAT